MVRWVLPVLMDPADLANQVYLGLQSVPQLPGVLSDQSHPVRLLVQSDQRPWMQRRSVRSVLSGPRRPVLPSVLTVLLRPSRRRLPPLRSALLAQWDPLRLSVPPNLQHPARPLAQSDQRP